MELVGKEFRGSLLDSQKKTKAVCMYGVHTVQYLPNEERETQPAGEPV